MATSINDSWFYCWQFKVDFMTNYATKKEGFVDLPDLYLSFIFNLLGNSFQIKSATEAMISASEKKDSVTFYQQLGYLLQIMYDFESYKAVTSSLFTYIVDAGKKHDELRGVAPKHLREASRHEAKLAARE